MKINQALGDFEEVFIFEDKLSRTPLKAKFAEHPL
jgi:hypothetical protein